MLLNVDVHGRYEQCFDRFHTRTLPCAVGNHVVDAGWYTWCHIRYTCCAGWRCSQLWCCMLPGMMRARTAGGDKRVMMVRQVLHVLAMAGTCLGLSNLGLYGEAP